MGLAASLFNALQPGGQGAGSSIFANPNFQSLAALAGAMGQGAMPSPVKVPFGAILGQAVGAMGAGANNANTFQQGANQAQAGLMQNQLTQASMPMQMALIKQQAALMGLGPNGQPLASGGSAGAAPSAPGTAPTGALLTPQMMLTYAQMARLQGDSRGEQAWLNAYNNYLPGRGMTTGPDGTVYNVPGSLPAIAAASNADQLGKNEADVATAAPEAAAAAAGKATSTPAEWVAKGPDGQFHTFYGTQAQENAAAGGAGSSVTPAQGNGAGASIMPAINAVPQPMQYPALIAAASAGMPPAAIPYWISSVQNESGWNPNIPNGKAGEIGIGQVKPQTAQMLGINPAQLADPQTNLIASAKYFMKGWQQGGGDPAKALAFYNTGDVTNPDTAYVQPAIARVAGWTGGQPNAQPAAQPGIEGAPEMTPEQEAASTALGEQEKSIIDGAAAAPIIKAKVIDLRQEAQNFRTGSTGEMRQDAQSLLVDAYQGLGLTPPAEIMSGAASAETISKIGAGLALDVSRSLGSREAAQIVMLTKAINPNVDFTTGGYKNVLNVIDQQAQYAQDLGQFRQTWLQTHSSIDGMMDAFEKINPPEVYASRVQPLDMPSSQADAKPNVIYQTPRGPLMWTGQGFTQPPAQQ